MRENARITFSTRQVKDAAREQLAVNSLVPDIP